MARQRKRFIRKYDDHRLSEVLTRFKGDHRTFLDAITGQPEPKRTASVHIIRGYDLRHSVTEKSIDTHKITKWTAFVNNAHTLCHVVARDGDLIVRIPLYFSLKGASDSFLEQVICGKVIGLLEL